ncbi:MAG: dihydropteroate synthase [Spirochaetales bacterium]|nr:dihydropteroate synthase [Spirochaetales bacterium]
MRIGNLVFSPRSRTYVMGILNITPDSFSDGGKYSVLDNAVGHAVLMEEEGADIIDVGGESTRPNHLSVNTEEEIARVIPVIKELVKVLNIPVSIDTSKALVAKEAVKAGASMINDVWGFKKDPEIAAVAAETGVACCLMHNRDNTNYNNLIVDIKNELIESIKIALGAGVKKDKIILDPGIGFGKTVEQNIEVLSKLSEIVDLGYPVLLGTSRKSMIGISLDLPVEERLEGTIATNVIGVNSGCSIIRVHDVKENLRAVRMTDIINRYRLDGNKING